MKKLSLLIIVTLAVAMTACSKKDKKSSVPVAPPPPPVTPNNPNGSPQISDAVLNEITDGVYVLNLIADELSARQNNESSSLPEDINPAQAAAVQVIVDHFAKTSCKIEEKTSTRYGNNIDTIATTHSLIGKRCGLELESKSTVKENNFGDRLSETAKLKVKLVHPELVQANKVFYTHMTRAQAISHTNINNGSFQFYTFGQKQFLTGTIASVNHGQFSVIGTLETKVTGIYPQASLDELIEVKIVGGSVSYSIKKITKNKEQGGVSEHTLNDQVISQYDYDSLMNKLGVL